MKDDLVEIRSGLAPGWQLSYHAPFPFHCTADHEIFSISLISLNSQSETPPHNPDWHTICYKPHRKGLMRIFTRFILYLFLPAVLSFSFGREGWAEETKSFWDRLHPNGDVRLRLENDFNRDATAGLRTRARFRLRLGTDIDIHEDMIAGFRLATGNLTDPQSPHQTFTGAFDRSAFSVDQAFVRWNPQFTKPLTLWLGKFAHPFSYPAVYKELVWDMDVQPEGGAIGLVFKDLGVLDEIRIVNGTYVLLEDSGAWMDAAQLATTIGITEKFKLTAASGFYFYNNVNAGGTGIDSIVRNDNGGNSSADADGDGNLDTFVAKFRIVDNFVNIVYTDLPMPLAFHGQYFHNFGSGAVLDDGYSFGAAYGQLKEPWDWRIYYQYQLVQQDAIFSPVSQDDFLRQTNFKGHVFGIAFVPYSRVDLHFWGLLDKLDSAGGGNMQARGRVDLNVRF